MSTTQTLKSYITSPLSILEQLALTHSRWTRFLSRQARHSFESRAFWRAYFCAMPDSLPVVVTEVRQGEDLVGLVWGGLTTAIAKGIIRERRLVAYRTGIEDVDKIWPEMNTPMLTGDCHLPKEKVLAAWHSAGQVQASEWHAFPSVKMPPVFTKEMEESGGYVDLLMPYTPVASVRRAVNQMVRYSRAHYDADLSIKAHTGEMAWQCVTRHDVHHVQKWSQTDTPSGLESNTYRMLLRRWICAVDSNVVVYEVSAGERHIGMVIMLQERTVWRYYLSSFAPHKKGTPGNHYHPGYWAHDQLIRLAKSQNIKGYDFMAGKERYKSQFSNVVPPDYARAIYRTRPTCYSLAEKVAEKLPFLG